MVERSDLCVDETRRDLLEESPLHGIDYIEVPFDDQKHFKVFFVPKEPGTVAPTLNDLASAIAGKITIQGGVRVVGIEVVDRTRTVCWIACAFVASRGE